jgi:hypothetical protein
VLEGRIVPADDGPGHDHGDLARVAALQEGVVEGLGEQVADLALRLGPEDVQRRRGHDGGGHLRADGKEADLRPIAVGDYDLGLAALRERDQAACGPRQVAPLDLGGSRLASPDERVSAQRDGQPGHPAGSSRSRSVISA